MTTPFLIPEAQLRALSATSQGRGSIAGYNYQGAYAVARLASMSIRQPVLDFINDWPQQMRYDWGEDLDEVCNDGTIRFTQCKRVATIGQPASLAEVLLGFAPKWLWVPEEQRDKLGFRLVCSDSRFVDDDALSASVKAEVLENFTAKLSEPAKPRSDRFKWAAEALKAGHEVLFEALWSKLECVYVSPEVVTGAPAGPRLEAEKEALRLLLEWGEIDSSRQPEVLGRLRRLIHDNLISFDPANESELPAFRRAPRFLSRADVKAALNLYRPPTYRPPPFQLVDRTFLSEQRELERKEFVARQPEWRDLVHGQDETIKFIERDQTAALELEVGAKVVARIGGAGKLPSLFVLGAPGDGKTTITRRVGARLVEAGTVLIADTGVGLQEPPGDPDEYVQALERILEFGCPVLLLLDDPVYAGSPWLEILKKLNRPGWRIGVLAASPQFLVDEHKSELKKVCEVEPFSMPRISQGEREALAAVHGRAVSPTSEDDFLVVAMETAAGVSFSKIIERLWTTIADGRDPYAAKTLSDLSWQARAYLFVCFFSRGYEACPEPLLEKLLEITGGVADGTPVASELGRMKHFTGWRIFRIGEATRVDRGGQRVMEKSRAWWTWASMDYEGAPIAAAHTVIARQAWEQRPLAWCDVGETIIDASLAVPTVIRDVASIAVRLTSPTAAKGKWSEDGERFAKRLIDRWCSEPGVETQYLARLVLSLSTLDRARWTRAARQTLLDRAVPDEQGWMAAQRLYYIPPNPMDSWGFPRGLDLIPIIRAADFSLWPAAAVRFAVPVGEREDLRNAYYSQLFAAFDGKLEWGLDTPLLGCLIRYGPQDELRSRGPQIAAWLQDHPEDYVVRGYYLSFLLTLPEEFSHLREAAALQTSDWLQEFTDANTNVRAQFLSFILKLPEEFSYLREAAARQTAKWLKDHPEDKYVRTKYLSFLLDLGTDDPAHLRRAAVQTEEWLNDHPDDNYLRTQYLTFLLKLRGPEFSDLREAVVPQTAEWLDTHKKDAIVRTKYLSFLLRLPAEFAGWRQAAARQTAQWLENNRDDVHVRTQFLSFLADMEVFDDWQRLATTALNDTVRVLGWNGYAWRHLTVVLTARRLHQKLLTSLQVNDSRPAREALKRSHDGARDWFRRNPAEPQREFPLP